MNNKNSSSKQKTAVRGLYITAIAAFAVIAASVVVSYYKTESYKPETTNSTADYSYYTNLAQADKTDVPDERTTQRQTAAESTHENSERETSYRPSTSKPTAESQTSQAQIVNSSFSFPCTGEILNHFSSVPVYSKTMGDWRTHLGTDFKANEGDEILSVGNGTVKKVVSDTKLGYTVEIDHGSFVARYCGLSQEGAAGIGKTVEKGSVIGFLGSIPIESEDEPHLHLEIVKDGVKIDPEGVF